MNRVRQKPVPPKIDEKQEERLSETERAQLSWKRCLLYEDSRLVGKLVDQCRASFTTRWFSDIFAGQLKSTLECSYCQYRSITFDMFWDLSIPLPRVGANGGRSLDVPSRLGQIVDDVARLHSTVHAQGRTRRRRETSRIRPLSVSVLKAFA